MGIVTVAEVENVTGICYTPAEAKRVQYYINYISALVEDYTGTAFTLQTDAVLRMQADAHGLIELDQSPIEEVSLVSYCTRAHPVVGTGEVPAWGFDGVSTIFGLASFLAVDVTMTYGYATAPLPVKGYVIEATKYVLANPNGLAAYRVGDVTQTYVSSEGQSTFTSLSNEALAPYVKESKSWHLGTYSPPGPRLPTL